MNQTRPHLVCLLVLFITAADLQRSASADEGGCPAGQGSFRVATVDGTRNFCADLPGPIYPIVPYDAPTAPGDGSNGPINPPAPGPGQISSDSTLGSHPLSGDGSVCAGNPIDVGTGNKYHAEVDYVGVGSLPLAIERHYNSKGASFAINNDVYGPGWRTNLAERIGAIELPPAGASPAVTTVIVFTASGARLRFESTNGGPWYHENGQEVAFEREPLTNEWIWVDRGITRIYHPTGLLRLVQNNYGESLAYEYDTNDRLETVTHSSGRTLTLTYDSQGRISTIQDPAGLNYQYFYDISGNLARIRKPTVSGNYDEVHYSYESGNLLTHVRHGTVSANAYAKWVYQSGRPVQSSHGATAYSDGIEKVTVSYGSDSGNIGRSTVNPLGKTTNYTFQTIAGVPRITSVAGVALGTCLAANRSYTYDSNGYFDKVTDWEGNVVDFDYDSMGNLTQTTQAFGTSEARTTAISWDSVLGLPTRVLTPVLDTSIAYDAAGRVVTISQRNRTANGVPNQSRNWAFSYTFHPSGVMASVTVNGPRTDVSDTTVYTYDTSARLTRIRNALNHDTLFSNFDAYGRPRTIQTPSGLARNLTYRADGKLLSVTDVVNGVSRVSTYTYNESGDVDTVTGPNGTLTDFSYEWTGSRRLQAIIWPGTRGQVFDYDNASNVTGHRIRREEIQWVPDPSCGGFPPPPTCGGSFEPVVVDAFKSEASFDALSRVTSVTSAGQTRSFTYNLNNQVASAKDGFNRATSFGYNNRTELDQTTYRDGGISMRTYTGDGSVDGVRDALGKWTYHRRDGFGQITTLISEAGGTRTYSYDTAGNLKTMTDARGITTTYNYDALNRLISVKAGSSPAETFEYDTNRKGFLYRVTDKAGTHTFTRNQAGEITQKASTVSSVSMTTSYTYDSAGRVQTMTYPSGLTLTYTYDDGANGNGELIRIWAAKSGMTTLDVVEDIVYYPWGSVNRLSYGNGEIRALSRTESYDPWRLSSGAHLNRTYGYDANGNITQIGGTAPSYTRTYGYDLMDRLDSHTGPDGSFEYSHDLNGNRLWHKENGVTTNYNYSSDKRLSSRSGAISEARTYDANGNTTRIGSQYFDYNDEDRLWRYRYGGSTVATYTHNAFGERMIKQVGSTTTRFVYDGPNLLHERTGSTHKDYIYLDGQVVGYVRTIGSSPYLYYVHGDHLGRPQVITNWSKQKVWESQSNAFDRTATLDSIGGFNVAFPGQYYDPESGKYYNYFRNYDSTTGRYLESDPIGLAGGMNTYSYVGGNPITSVDPFGLFAPEAVADAYQSQYEIEACGQIDMDRVWRDLRGQLGAAVLVGTILVPGPEDVVLVGALGKIIGRLRGARAADDIEGVPNPGGRLGKTDTRQHVGEVADELESRGFEITGGGGRLPEEYLPGPGGGRAGSNFPDVTATKSGRTVRVNTVDTLKDGVTPSAREARAAAKIRAKTPGDHLILIPKPRGQ